MMMINQNIEHKNKQSIYVLDKIERSKILENRRESILEKVN